MPPKAVQRGMVSRAQYDRMKAKLQAVNLDNIALRRRLSEGVPDHSPVEPDCGVDPKRPQEPSSAGRGPQKEASRSSPGGGRQKAASRWVNYERAMEGPASGGRE